MDLEKAGKMMMALYGSKKKPSKKSRSYVMVGYPESERDSDGYLPDADVWPVSNSRQIEAAAAELWRLGHRERVPVFVGEGGDAYASGQFLYPEQKPKRVRKMSGESAKKASTMFTIQYQSSKGGAWYTGPRYKTRAAAVKALPGFIGKEGAVAGRITTRKEV